VDFFGKFSEGKVNFGGSEKAMEEGIQVESPNSGVQVVSIRSNSRWLQVNSGWNFASSWGTCVS